MADRQGQLKSDLPDPAFLVVGTPRSGTTLVQRLISQFEAVRMPPETHFFSLYAPLVLARRRFPLEGTAAREEIRSWASNDGLRGLPVDIDRVMDRLGGFVGSLWEMFAAIVVELSGEGAVYGEKTPTHLTWWRPLARHVPNLKFIAVVRDPRAVVASSRDVPFGMRGHVLQAERWAADQRLVLNARSGLDSGRILVLRYEDVVAEPDAATLEIASFLGIEDSPRAVGHSGVTLHQPWEEWKERASAPVTTDRVEAWRSELDHRARADVAAICRREMVRFGYLEDVPGAAAGLVRLSRLSPSMQWRRFHFRLGRRVLKRQLDSPRVAAALRRRSRMSV